MLFLFLRTLLPLFVAMALVAPAPAARAEGDAVSITLTPPLIQLSVSPGESWSSSIKVTNTNEGDLVVYPALMDFSADDEDGHPRFSPVIRDGGLASWISVATSGVTIAPQTSRDIPFSVHIPGDAPPGGHYAAILIGTRPPEGGEGSRVKVASMVSSLMFVRVQGDILERGMIRSFTADRTRYEDGAPVEFAIRFGNEGNVHLQPQGGITIADAFGRERGRTLINEQSAFGNVLPGSTRRFLVPWTAPQGIGALGRYTATVTLTYGREARQNATQTIVFWVVPTRPLAIAFGIVALLVLALRFFVRRAVRRAVQETGESHASPRIGRNPADQVLDLRRSSSREKRVGAAWWSVRIAGIVILAIALWITLRFAQ